MQYNIQQKMRHGIKEFKVTNRSIHMKEVLNENPGEAYPSISLLVFAIQS